MKKVIAFLVAFSTLLDIFTAIAGNLVLETNPIYLATNSIALVIAVKILIIAAFILLYLKADIIFRKFSKTGQQFWNFILLVSAIMVIILQIHGSFSNISSMFGSQQEPVAKVYLSKMYFLNIMIPYLYVIGAAILFFLGFTAGKKMKRRQ